jgi:lysophospholipid acyltransferase (LPLAT)-like uncharacterized protein
VSAPRWLRAVAPPLGAAAVRGLGATLRMRTAGVELLRPYWTAGRPLIYVIWHGRILLGPWINARLRRTSGGRAVSVLTSRSDDGEMVARYVARFGVGVVRGSSSRGGAAAARTLAATVARGQDIVIVPDGPRGPSGRLQDGVIALAALTGAPVVPMAIAARPARRLPTWDRFLVPAPFARAAVVFGTPIVIEREADRERAAKDVQAALDETTAAADRMVGR